MKIPTCADCEKWFEGEDGCGYCDHCDRITEGNAEFCPFFISKDGKRPRFCKLAVSVNEMACTLVRMCAPGWTVPVIGTAIYATFDDAFEVALKWLLEMEDGE